jgi:hypothetical protein
MGRDKKSKPGLTRALQLLLRLGVFNRLNYVTYQEKNVNSVEASARSQAPSIFH